MKVFVTKYALSRGVLEIEGEISEGIPSMFVRRGEWASAFFKPYWHENWGDAVCHAEELRQKAIRAAERKIKKLRDMSFATVGHV
jgi:hypothetical protein